jgi:hypothetical protein
VINRVEAAFLRRATVEPFFWDGESMRAVTDFQSQIHPVRKKGALRREVRGRFYHAVSRAARGN